MSKPIVEEFNENDAIGIARLFQRVWPFATDYPLAWRRKRTMSPDEIRQEITEKKFQYFGVRMNGRIVGVYKLSVNKEILGEQQAVDPDYRNQGLARIMYNQFLELGSNLNKPNCINILIKNKKMIKFVTKLGFQPFGTSYEQHPGMIVQKFRFKNRK